MSDLKYNLYLQCRDYVQKRTEAAQLAIEEAQKASNDDTKSSAGDKYETSREMMQQETDRNMAQLNEANKLKVALNRVNPNTSSNEVESGSLVFTDNGNFYLAIAAGRLMVGDDIYFAVSPESPVGLKLRKLKKGDQFLLNGKLYTVKTVV